MKEHVLDLEAFSQIKVKAKYPQVLLKSINETTPLIVGLLESGDMPLIGEYNGVRKVLCYISPSAYNVDKLIRTHNGVSYVKAPEDSKDLVNIQMYLEVF